MRRKHPGEFSRFDPRELPPRPRRVHTAAELQAFLEADGQLTLAGDVSYGWCEERIRSSDDPCEG